MTGKIKSEKGIILFVIPEKNYASAIGSIASSVSSAYSRICYVCLSKPYQAILDSFKKHGISQSKFFFVDCTGKGSEGKEQVVYVSSPKALTEMSITIGKVIQLGKIEALILDSLSTLLVYEQPSTVVRFVHSLISMLRENKVNGYMICLKGGMNLGVVKDISMFADRVMA